MKISPIKYFSSINNMRAALCAFRTPFVASSRRKKNNIASKIKRYTIGHSFFSLKDVILSAVEHLPNNLLRRHDQGRDLEIMYEIIC